MNKYLKTIIIGVCAACMLSGCASWSRMNKSIASNMSGGLDRTVTVYDYSGNEIKHWTGKFDVSSSESEVFFDDAEGNRVIVHGGIVINEEN